MGLFTAFPFAATATGTTPTLRTTPDRLIDVINARDWGAKGDGTTNDSPALQAALDKCFGPVGSPNPSRYVNKALHIPRGNYRCVTPLIVAPHGAAAADYAGGGFLFGDGQKQTRLFYDGAPTNHLIEMREAHECQYQGITFDGNGIADVAVQATDSNGNHAGGSIQAGRIAYWFDVGIKNAAISGMVFDVSALGSEQRFDGCTFSGNPTFGFLASGPNALNYVFNNCVFKNNGYGIAVITGGVIVEQNCYFENNATIDVWSKYYSPTVLQGCYSRSNKFAAGSALRITGCTHVSSSPGVFVDHSGAPGGLDGPYEIFIEGCYSSNSVLLANSAVLRLWSKCNQFDRSDWLDGWIANSVMQNT